MQMITCHDLHPPRSKQLIVVLPQPYPSLQPQMKLVLADDWTLFVAVQSPVLLTTLSQGLRLLLLHGSAKYQYQQQASSTINDHSVMCPMFNWGIGHMAQELNCNALCVWRWDNHGDVLSNNQATLSTAVCKHMVDNFQTTNHNSNRPGKNRPSVCPIQLACCLSIPCHAFRLSLLS